MISKDIEFLSFGKRLKRLRKEQNFSQEEFALVANIHRTYISGIERGERNPTLTMICRLAKALKVHPSELIKETN